MFLRSVADNPLLTRADLARSLQDLWRPLRPYLNAERSFAKVGDLTANYGERIGGLEAIARPLWGLAPLSAGGGPVDWKWYRQIVTAGVDPCSPCYWGDIKDNDQRAVEMGAIAFTLLIAPGDFWANLEPDAQRNLSRWLYKINQVDLYSSNWLWFRVLINTALQSVGERSDPAQRQKDRTKIDSFYRNEGWFTDGGGEQRDYYIPMAMHFYGLVLSKLDASHSSADREKVEQRARLFAEQFKHWFSAAGAAVPFGRSLTYRFAQGAFWGALAFAGIEALPWGQIKGLYLRHLRAWFQLPIFSETGLLTVGYGYPNNIMAEAYNGPASPYWAFKIFLPLALPDAHPFWQAVEEPLALETGISIQRTGGFVLSRDAERDHVFALASQQVPVSHPRHSAQKYGKFVYSTAFGFSVPIGGSAAEFGGGDSMLLVSLNQTDWRPRGTIDAETWNGPGQHTRWSPFPEVQIDSWIMPVLPGHLRVHRIKTPVSLYTFEGGFPLIRDEDLKIDESVPAEAAIQSSQSFSLIRDLADARQGSVVHPEPGTHLLHPLTSLPGLVATLAPGETWLFTAVVGLPGGQQTNHGRRWAQEFSVLPQAIPPQILRNGVPVLTCSITGDTSEISNHGLRPLARPQTTRSLPARLASALVRFLKKRK